MQRKHQCGIKFKYIADHNCPFYIDDASVYAAFLASRYLSVSCSRNHSSYTFLTMQRFLDISDQAILPAALPPSLSSVSYRILFRHRNMSFTTRDRDNDVEQDGNCAVAFRGGWWYSACHVANPNGLYQGGSRAQGITWAPFRGQDYSLKHIEIKLRPV